MPKYNNIKRPFLQPKPPHTQSGLSLVIALALIGLIMIFTMGVTTLVVDTFRQSSNVRRGTEAYYAAEGGLEVALLKNKMLKEEGNAVGASFQSDAPTGQDHIIFPTGFPNSTFRISGRPDSSLPATSQTVDGKFIIPAPWTGDTPWTGLGEKIDGGCDPYRPPILNSDQKTMVIGKDVDGNDITINAIDHPCNWGKILPGQKVSIPLYSTGSAATSNFSEFTLKLRTPCFDGSEYCEPAGRAVLNCFDKGELKCVALDSTLVKQKPKGEVIAQWQIDGVGASGELLSLSPYDIVKSVGIKQLALGDSQLSEGKINYQNGYNDYVILNSNISIAFPKCANDLDCGFDANNPKPNNIDIAYPIGKSSESLKALANVKTFIEGISKPVLKISVIGDLIGCTGNSSTSTACAIKTDGTSLPKIPYLEYQVVLSGASLASKPPSNLENIITAEGQSGPFTQTIQVKVPHESSSIDYVIQQ